MSKPTVNQWREVCKYFSAMLKDYPIFRRSFLNNLGNKGCQLTNVETYRCYLVRAGYLEIAQPGIYKRLKAIPRNLTVRQCYEEAYPKSVAKRLEREKFMTAQACLS
jgi:hypothetical protein